MISEDFEKLVQQALVSLPQKIKDKMDNIVLCLEENPSKEQLKGAKISRPNNLLGLYEGIPKNVWGRGLGNNLPDKITIFEKPIREITTDSKELETLIKEVVWHEIAHHFGFEEKEVALLERKRKEKNMTTNEKRQMTKN